jgi:membrane protein YdbS with pleckstrin-like domain
MSAGDPDLMKEHLSTWLSSAAILAVAAGVTWGLWQFLGPWSLCIGGVVLALLVAIADVLREPAQSPPPAEPTGKPQPPGPTDPGNVHVSGHR